MNQVAPGVAGNVDNIVSQIGNVMQVMASGASTPMMWATGIGAAVSIGVGLITSGIQQMKEAEEEKRIDESIQSWKTWEEETCAAIQGQIDALDELEKQQESEEKRREYENKRQAAELQLKYEKDDYNRKQIQMQIAQMEAEETKRLEEELEAAQELSARQQEALEKEKETVAKQYEELLSEFNLRAQAEKAIMESSQKEILELIILCACIRSGRANHRGKAGGGLYIQSGKYRSLFGKPY